MKKRSVETWHKIDGWLASFCLAAGILVLVFGVLGLIYKTPFLLTCTIITYIIIIIILQLGKYTTKKYMNALRDRIGDR